MSSVDVNLDPEEAGALLPKSANEAHLLLRYLAREGKSPEDAVTKIVLETLEEIKTGSLSADREIRFWGRIQN